MRRGAQALERPAAAPLADPDVAQVDVAALAAEVTTLSAALARAWASAPSAANGVRS